MLDVLTDWNNRCIMALRFSSMGGPQVWRPAPRQFSGAASPAPRRGGADPATDAGGTSGDQTAAGNFVVIVGGRPIPPVYAGASHGYPGLWQIHFTLPPDIEPDGFAWVQVSTAGAKFGLPISGPRFGNCRVYDRTYPASGFDPASPNTFLDGGARLPLSGPTLGPGAGLAQSPSALGPAYLFVPNNPFQTGLYTLTGPAARTSARLAFLRIFLLISP